MPNEQTLFHGTTADNLLKIIKERCMRPDAHGEVYFSEKFDDALQHGADMRRGASFAFEAAVTIPVGASLNRAVRHGNPYTVVVKTVGPLPTRLVRLYVRLGRVGAFELKTISGVENIRTYLENPAAAGGV